MTGESTPQRDDWALPLMGLVFLVLVGWLTIFQLHRELTPSFSYVEVQCLVLDKRVAEFPSRRAPNSTYRPELLIRYEVDGKSYETWAYTITKSSSALRWPKEQFLEQFTVGEAYPCWYDPDDPSQVVIVRGLTWMSYVPLLISVVLILLIAKGIHTRLHSVGRIS